VTGKPADKANWVQRVLGVTVLTPGQKAGEAQAAPTSGANGAAPGWPAARQAWQDANDAVNDQINGLRKVLLDRAKSGDADADEYAEALIDIAENGLNAMMDNHRVKMMSVVMALGDGSGTSIGKNGATALEVIEAFTTFLDGSEKIEVCDANPFGAPVSIKATLTPPLHQMAAALRAALKP
jgi:hypothetical protein